MASDSSRSRIDQFYASRKRKPLSPGLKSGKDARGRVETSPVKGNLDNYFVSSPENERVSQAQRGLLGRHDSLVRRNLGLEIDVVSRSEDSAALATSAEVHMPPREVVQMARKETSQGSSNAVDASGKETGKEGPVLVGCGEESELKQFATDFLSLYCGGLKSTATSPLKPKLDHKRHGSPLLVDGEDKSSKKRHCLSHDLRLEGETVLSIEKKTEDTQSTAVVKNGASIICATGQVAVVNDSVQLQGSLRKCNMVPKSTLDTDEQTPGSLVAKAGVCEIPKSSSRSRGSSLYSPGEAFWNEAIVVADGLLGDADNPDAQVTEDIINGCNKSSEMLSKDGSGAQQMGHGNSLELVRMRSKNSVKEMSPLPVKHLDFMFEDKNLDISTPCHATSNTSKCRDGELSERCSANVKARQTADIATHHCNDQRNEGMHEAEEISYGHGMDTRKVNLLNQDPDKNITSRLPINEIMNSLVNIKYAEAVTPSSFVPLKDQLDLSNWLPAEVCSTYKRKGMSKLYPWQVDCLQVDGVLQRKNLVYCASTSAGKSFVAEILMLRQIMTIGKIALLVLPYVSICSEKAEHLEGLLEPLGKNVRSYYGNQGGGTLPKDTSVAVCTIEKANSLVNKLLEEGRLSEIGIIVIDELHMVGDQRRGYLLELLLTKLRYAAGEGNSESSSGESSGTSSKGDPARGLQMVGMSATMPNVAAVADWLQAALYQTDFRPVPLEEFIKIGNTIYNKKMEIVRTIPRAADLGGKDPDHILELCNEVVQEGHSVLMFCSSRKGCESTAKHISKFLKKFTVKIQGDSEFADMASAIDALRRCPVGLDPVLEETLPCGVAYHHAGLTVEEREVIETCYRRGLLRVLTATSTLAAGVNLPARRVIFRQPRIGRDFIDGTRYKQMAGRAGRTGIDTKGESVLICKPEELKRIMGLLNESCPPLQSCLSEDKNGMTHAILEVVAGGIVQTADDIHRYVRCTLLNSTKPFQDVVKSAQDSLRWLCHKKFLEWNDDTKLYSSTPLGRASFGSSLSPEESLIVLDDLSRAREAFVLASDLHLVYLVTPINVDVEPNWELYYERFMELSALDQSVGNRVGVSEPYLMRMAHGAPMRTLIRSTDNTKGLHGKAGNLSVVTDKNMIADEQILRVCKRFYVALILSRLVQEVPVAEVCEAFKVARGMVQALQENAGRFASMVSMFCERLGWHDVEGLVARFQNRVSFGVKAEIAELTTIPFVKGSRARALYKAGFRTPLAIAEASIPELVKALFESSSWAAQEGLAQRRLHLGVVKKIKNGARKIVLEKAEEARVAAFSAFKSLGLDVPQFSQPLLPNDSGNLVEEGDTSNMLGDQTKIIHSVEQKDHASSKLCVEGIVNSEVPSESEAGKFEKGYNVEQVGPAGVNSNAHTQCHFGAENSTVPVRNCLTPDVGLHDKNADASLSMQLGNNGDAIAMYGRTIDSGIQRNGEITHGEKKDSVCEKGPINASRAGGIDSFLDLWGASQEFYLDIHYSKRSGVNSVTPFEIHGIAVCWEKSPVYYVNLPKDLLWSENQQIDDSPLTAPGKRSHLLPENCEKVRDRWQRIGEIMGRKEVRKFTWNLKIQVQVIKSAIVSIQRASSLTPLVENLGFELIDNSHLLLPPIHIREAIDLSIVTWVLWPDEERSSNPNLEKEVKKRLSSEAVAAANRSGRWKNQTRRVAHNGCCRRVAHTRALCSVLWKLLISEGLVEALMQIEIPLVNVLADMELWGIGVDMEGCLRARNVLGKKLRHLEKKAYDLAGKSFSLSSAADIANVLYGHLKLPVPKTHKKGKHHPSTDKHCLDLLRNEHPIIPVIKEHRTLAKLLNSTLGSICSLARLSMSTQKYTLHGHWLQTSTATGRLSMEEPNLQCVEHMVDFELNMEKSGSDPNVDHYKVNARDFLVPTQDNWLLLSADYSQIELRLMAHFSQDASLIELLSKPHGDVFTMIAARWTGKPEDSVCPDERDHTKGLVYGILYGMGAKTLAEQLNCSSDEAAERIKSFKNSFPGVASWLNEAVASCCRKGFVETLKGRKRFLSKIKFGNNEEKSKAQRQAVNSICQGSAADLIKIAMIRIYSVIVEGVDKLGSSSSSHNFLMLKGRCRIILQVHDELVLEVEPSVVKEAALLLQMSMESAAALLVPLQVKQKVGRTWGSLEPFAADQYVNDDLPVVDS